MLSDQNLKVAILFENQLTCKVGLHNINK